MPVVSGESGASTSVRRAIDFFGGGATDSRSQSEPPEQQSRLPCPQSPAPSSNEDCDEGGGGGGGGQPETGHSPASTPGAPGAADQAGRPRFLSLDPGEVYDAFDGQRSGLLKPSQLAQRRAAPPRQTNPPVDRRETDWNGLTKKAFLWSRFSDEDRRLVLQTPRGRRRSVPATGPKHRNDNFEAAFHKFQELGKPRAARGRERPAGGRPPPPALVPIWLPGGLNSAARWPGSGESRTSSSGTPETSPRRAVAVTPERRSLRSDGSGSGSDHVFPAESPEAARHSGHHVSSLSRVRLVPAGPGSHQERGSAQAVAGPKVPRPASMPPDLPVSSTQQHSRTGAADIPQRSDGTPKQLGMSGEKYQPPSNLSEELVPPLRPVEWDPDKDVVAEHPSTARPDAGDIEIGLGEDERHSVSEDSEVPANEESAGEDEEDKPQDEEHDKNGPSAGEEADKAAEAGADRPPPPPRRRVQVERHNSEVHLRLSRSSEQMIRELERVQYEPGQTDEDGVELRKKKPKSFRRKLKEVLRRAKEDEALLQDFTEYLVVVRPDKMILKRVGDVAREEPPPQPRAARGRGGRHHCPRRPHTESAGPDDVFISQQIAEPRRGRVTPPAMPWVDPDKEIPFSPRYAADGSPASTLSATSKGTGSEEGSPATRESLVEFISRHSQRPRLEARRRLRPAAATGLEAGGCTVLPPNSARQPHHDQPIVDKLSALVDAQGGGKEAAQGRCQLAVETSGDRARLPVPPSASSPIQSPDSTQAGERPATGYDVSRYTEDVTPPEPQDRSGGQMSDVRGPCQSPTDAVGEQRGTVEEDCQVGGRSDLEGAQTDIHGARTLVEEDRDEGARSGAPAVPLTQLETTPEQTPAGESASDLTSTPESPSAALSPPNVTITRVSRPRRPPSSPPSEASRQLLKRPSSGGQTLPLKKRRLETEEQKSQPCCLLGEACGPQIADRRRAHHLDMALVKGYEFLFQPASEEHAITRILNPSFEPALAQGAPALPGPNDQGDPRYPATQRLPRQQHLQHRQQQPVQNQPHPRQYPQQHHQQQQQQQQEQPRPHRHQTECGQGTLRKNELSVVPAAAAGPVRPQGMPSQPRLPAPPPPGTFAVPYPAAPLPLPPPHPMSPSVHALFEAYKRASRPAAERGAFRLYEPGGQERPRPPPPPYGAGWQHPLQYQQQQQLELQHQQWLQQERHYHLQREHQHHQTQQQQLQLQQQHMQQLQYQKQQQDQLPQERPDQQMQLHHHQQQHQLQSYQQHYQHHQSQQGQQKNHQQQPNHHLHRQQQPQHQPERPDRQHQQASQRAHQPALHHSASSAALSGSWGSSVSWCPGEAAPDPTRPAACYPCPEYSGLRRHVYPALGEPWAPVGPAGWPPRPGAL